MNYWEALTDEELIAAEMTTADPERLEGLVSEVPPGVEEPHVEFKYDESKSGREEFRCVHGHHRHLKGFVMKKGNARFLVGWMCGKSIYGADFDKLTADFDAAVTKRDTLRRVRNIRQAIEPFGAWLNEVAKSDVFVRFESVREQAYEHMPWVFENLAIMSVDARELQRLDLPSNLFDENNDPELDWTKASSEFHTIAMQAIAKDEWAEKNLVGMKRSIESILKRLEAAIARLRELETFFQPSILSAICKYANDGDNPKKRRYVPGLLMLTCKRWKNDVVLHLPKKFQLPSQKRIDDFRKTLHGLNFV